MNLICNFNDRYFLNILHEHIEHIIAVLSSKIPKQLKESNGIMEAFVPSVLLDFVSVRCVCIMLFCL